MACRLSASEREAFLDSLPPRPPEFIPVGFTCGDAEPCGTGFAGGGCLDVLEPGPVLAEFAGEAHEAGLARLS